MRTRGNRDRDSAPPPTSVHLLETNDLLEPDTVAAQPPPDPDASITFRHSGWAHRRRQVRTALAACDVSDKRLERFDSCGWGGWVWQAKDDPGKFKLTGNYCHDRWCLPCGAARGRTIARNLVDIIGDSTVRFVTLTLRHNDQPLSETITRLLKSFARLRRFVFWKQCVLAGASFLEIKRSEDGRHWHPHLHIVAEGNYIPHAQLKAAWYRITGDSYIVDVRPCDSRDHLVWYVTKYVSKPLDNTVFSDPATTEQAIRAMHGRRTCTTFGDWRGRDLTIQSDETEWVSIGPLSELLRDASHGDEGAHFVLSQLSVETSEPRRPET